MNIGNIEYRYWVVIKLMTKEHNGDIVQVLRWDELTFAVRLKWDWYFRYRAALLKVQHPKMWVNFSDGNMEYREIPQEELNRKRLIPKKAQLTKWRNLLRQAEQNWTSMFPIEEDEDYIKALCKVKNLEKEIEELL